MRRAKEIFSWVVLIITGGMIIVVLVLSAGCATKIEKVPHPVYIPIPVPCVIEKVETPVWAFSTVRATDDIETKTRALLAERRQRIAHLLTVEAAQKPCEVAK